MVGFYLRFLRPLKKVEQKAKESGGWSARMQSKNSTVTNASCDTLYMGPQR